MPLLALVPVQQLHCLHRLHLRPDVLLLFPPQRKFRKFRPFLKQGQIYLDCLLMHVLVDDSGFADAMLGMIFEELLEFWAELGVADDFLDEVVVEVLGTENKLVSSVGDK